MPRSRSVVRGLPQTKTFIPYSGLLARYVAVLARGAGLAAGAATGAGAALSSGDGSAAYDAGDVASDVASKLTAKARLMAPGTILNTMASTARENRRGAPARQLKRAGPRGTNGRAEAGLRLC